MTARRGDFEEALDAVFSAAEQLGLSFIGLTAGELHRRVGGYPAPNHRMPMCCQVMRDAMADQDAIISAPPKGDGASLLIRYSLPRR